jgi:hypothetical protein
MQVDRNKNRKKVVSLERILKNNMKKQRIKSENTGSKKTAIDAIILLLSNNLVCHAANHFYY